MSYTNSNLAGIGAFVGLSHNAMAVSKSLARLAASKRIVRSADDPASLAVATVLETKVDSLSQSMRNINDGIGLVQTAGAAAGEVNTILSRMRSLAVQSSNGTLNNTQRGAIQTEYQELASELDRVAQGATFNGIQLMDGSVPLVTVQAGEDGSASSQIDAFLPDLTSGSIGVNGTSVDTQAAAQSAISQIDAAMDRVSHAQSTYGSTINRLESAFRTADSRHQALTAAASNLVDADYALEASELAKGQVQDKAKVAVLAQANKLRLAAASLI